MIVIMIIIIVQCCHIVSSWLSWIGNIRECHLYFALPLLYALILLLHLLIAEPLVEWMHVQGAKCPDSITPLAFWTLGWARASSLCMQRIQLLIAALARMPCLLHKVIAHFAHGIVASLGVLKLDFSRDLFSFHQDIVGSPVWTSTMKSSRKAQSCTAVDLSLQTSFVFPSSCGASAGRIPWLHFIGQSTSNPPIPGMAW